MLVNQGCEIYYRHYIVDYIETKEENLKNPKSTKKKFLNNWKNFKNPD